MKNIKKLTLATLTFLAVFSTQASECYLGEVKIVGFNFVPRGYVEANGQLLSIAQNTALFSLYGTIYGGDGRTTFGVPDLRGRAPIHSGTGPGLTPVQQGQKFGSETTTVNVRNMPVHSHSLRAVKVNDNGANNSNSASTVKRALYAEVDASTPSTSITTNSAGGIGDTSFDNRQPSLGVKYVICAQGIYPSRS